MLGLADESVARAVADHRADARRQIAEDPQNRAG
jgi:hypothetical protein